MPVKLVKQFNSNPPARGMRVVVRGVYHGEVDGHRDWYTLVRLDRPIAGHKVLKVHPDELAPEEPEEKTHA